MVQIRGGLVEMSPHDPKKKYVANADGDVVNVCAATAAPVSPA